ncbi:MAG: CopG family transcriptional regulator [Pseudomonadota bacterium]
MPKSKDKRVRTSVILPEEVYEQIVKLSNANDVSVAWVMRQAVVKFLATAGDVKGLKLKKAKE